MKKLLFLLFCFVVLSASDCNKKESGDCHKSIIIKNNSSDTIIVALLATSNNLCSLTGTKTAPNNEFILPLLRNCWEDELSNGKSQNIYIVDPNKFNTPQVFYDCDSIQFKNKILKYFFLTIDSLRSHNFIITYQ